MAASVRKPTAWKSIVVAIGDLSAKKQVGLQKAQLLAQRLNARVTLLHVFAMPYPVSEGIHSTKEILAEAVKTFRLQLQHLAKPLQRAGLKVSCAVEWDFPTQDGIVRYVLRTKPDLLVAESHHHNQFARWLLNNTDWELIRACPCPLWFVKKPNFATSRRVLAAVDPFHAFAKPAQLDQQIASTASYVSKAIGGKLTLAHACDISAAVAVAAPLEAMPVMLSPQRVRELKTNAERALQTLAKEAKVKGADHVVGTGPPSDVIQRLAKRLPADVVVMGAISRRGLKRVFIGNTAERIIDPIRSDVLILKPKGFKTTVSTRKPAIRR